MRRAARPSGRARCGAGAGCSISFSELGTLAVLDPEKPNKSSEELNTMNRGVRIKFGPDHDEERRAEVSRSQDPDNCIAQHSLFLIDCMHAPCRCQKVSGHHTSPPLCLSSLPHTCICEEPAPAVSSSPHSFEGGVLRVSLFTQSTTKIFR